MTERKKLALVWGAAAVIAAVAIVSAAPTQVRTFTYERRDHVDPCPETICYVEIFNVEQVDLDSTATITIQHSEIPFPDKASKVAELTQQRNIMLLRSQQLANRINAINALP